MERLSVLGSTGSIGQSALSVLSEHRHRYQLIALSAHQDAAGLLKQCRAFKPRFALMHDARSSAWLKKSLNELGLATQVLPANTQSYQEVVSQSEIILSGISGAAGFEPARLALEHQRKLLLANKEPLIIAGKKLVALAKPQGAALIPVDSEHIGLLQCMPTRYRIGLEATHFGAEKLYLTGTGGPFWGLNWQRLQAITPDQASRHPIWNMGQKISIDSATMMNKALELIEVCVLFHVPHQAVEVAIDPRGLLHAAIAYQDGSLMCQLAQPDMRVCIAAALSYPERMTLNARPISLWELNALELKQVTTDCRPLELARQCCEQGGAAPAILNGANEAAVAAFVQGNIGFTEIADWVERCLSALSGSPAGDIDQLLYMNHQANLWVRQRTSTTSVLLTRRDTARSTVS